MCDAAAKFHWPTMREPFVVIAAIWGMSSGGCDFERDNVLPGAYGELRATSGANPPAAGGGGSPAAAAQPSAAGRPPMTGLLDTHLAHAGAAGPASVDCDLTGRWLMSVHKVTDGLGVLQTTHEYHYIEIARRGADFEIARSLFCHMDTIGDGAFAVEVSWSAALPAILARAKQDGRKITSREHANGCSVGFERRINVLAATVPYYLDPNTTLPNADEMASHGKPGWEDWDGDGNPGLTGVTSGTIVGRIFVAPREWSELGGTVPSVSSRFRLALKWDQEANVMSFDGSPLLGSQVVRAADATLHFVELARLSVDQAQGSDDSVVCASLLPLVPTLTPEAAGM